MTIITDKGAGRRTRDGATAALRGVGVRLTGPRRRVLEVVRGTDAHPTAEAVHQAVGEITPEDWWARTQLDPDWRRVFGEYNAAFEELRAASRKQKAKL